MLYRYDRFSPKIGKNCFIAPSAEIIGDVEVGDGSSVWFNATLRGDLGSIRIGRNVSVQDNCVVHTEPGIPVGMGDNIAIGHRAIVHSAMIGNNCIIGMGSVLLSGARIGSTCIIGAGSVVTEGSGIPDNSIAVGVPAKVVGKVSEGHAERIRENVQSYIELNARYLEKRRFEKI